MKSKMIIITEILLCLGLILLCCSCANGGAACTSKEDCPSSNQVCILTTGVCCTQVEASEVTCNDGADNDCDNATDCMDPDCDCDPGDNYCIVDSDGDDGKEDQCADGKDNDCDHKEDCEDEDCDGQDCGNGNKCVNGVCEEGGGPCEPDENSESDCSDGKDSDCDGKTDCEDTVDCESQSCAGGGTCENGSCSQGNQVNCTVTENPEKSCSDGKDNDCDGLKDGADSDCQNQLSCKPGTECDKKCLCGAKAVYNKNCKCICDDPQGVCTPGEVAKGLCGGGCGDPDAKCKEDRQTRTCIWACNCEDDGWPCVKRKKFATCNECTQYADDSCLRDCPGTKCGYIGGGTCGIVDCYNTASYSQCYPVAGGCCGSSIGLPGC